MKTLRALSMMATATLLLAACNKAGPEKQNQGGKTIRVAVIPKGTTHEFWKSIHAGAVQAAQELTAAGTRVEVIWKGPLREDDREQQIQVMEDFLGQGVQGIVLAPLDEHALARPVEEARQAGLPTVIIDSDLDSDAKLSFVATDNYKGGVLAADRMNELLGGKGAVILLRYAEGSASTHNREEGFLAELKKYPGLHLISSDQYSGATRETAKRASENLLNRFGDQVQGIFTPNESATVGMLLALQDVSKAGQIKFVGFDASTTLIDALRAQQIQGLVVQNPMKMGYLGVKTLVEHLQGKAVPRRIDTGVTLVTPEALDSPAVKELLYPPLDKYLGTR